MNHLLWYNKVTDDWMKALPLGNGKIAAMIYGNPNVEKIAINEESLWSGRQIEEKYVATEEKLNTVRELLFAENYESAALLAEKTLMASPRRLRYYESFGEIKIEYKAKRPYSEFRKELDLSEGIASVSYMRKYEASYKSESFVSAKHNVLVYKMHTEDKEPFSCSITMERAQDSFTSTIDDNTLVLNGQITYKANEAQGAGGEGMRFGGILKIVTDGVCISEKKCIHIENATNFVIYASFATNYNVKNFDIDETIDYKATIATAVQKAIDDGYDNIKNEHIKTHKQLYERVSLVINDEEKNNIPTDAHFELIKGGEWDNGFLVRYFNFGRYLLLCSSGKNATLPANLQGKWCNEFTPPWGSDYHTNINLQMNYWPALPLNMTEVMAPFVHFVKMLSKCGKKTAKKLYGTNGWVAHLCTDVFGRTGVYGNVSCGFFPLGGLWLCLNLWEQYEFTNSREYLEEIYPVIKSACEFAIDFLVESPEGYLVTNPSNSPENTFYYIDQNGEKKTSMFTYGTTMDTQIIHCIFTKMIYACHYLDRDVEFAKLLENALNKLPPIRVSKRYGTVCEWIKDYEEAEPGHRHMSHLFGLYPGDQINENDQEVFEAAKKTLERRLYYGGAPTGWSRAWIVNFYARLKDGNTALEHLKQLMLKSTAENLFDTHPPFQIFQIDGNFGSISGIAEMLVQSHAGDIGERIIEFLPALPDEWESGQVKGLKVRGDFSIDITWERGKAKQITIMSNKQGIFRFKLNERTKDYKITTQHSKLGDVISFVMQKGESIVLNFA